MKFELKAQDAQSKARAGELHTDHGVIHTPIFMPVGTVGTVKGVHQRELKEDINAEIILGNTYHLYLRPGTEILKLVACTVSTVGIGRYLPIVAVTKCIHWQPDVRSRKKG